MVDDADASELAVAGLVNRVVHPDVDLSDLEGRLDALVPAPTDLPWAHLRNLGFQGDERGLLEPDNSCVVQVLRRRRGLPITLAIVLIEVARRQGRVAVGLNAPGHFLASIDRLAIDPVQMLVMPIDAVIPRASTTDIALRMLNNLKQGCLSRSMPHAALSVLEHQLAIAGALHDQALEAGLQLETGNCWYALNLPELALESYERCGQLAGEGSQLASAADARIQVLKRMPRPTLH